MLHKLPPDCICFKNLHVSEQQVDRWIKDNRKSNPSLAKLFEQRLANKPACKWLGDWLTKPKEEARQLAWSAKEKNSLYQVVIYNVPNRDAGGFSKGGASSRKAYLSWIDDVASGLSVAEGIIIVEPDALAHAAQMNSHLQAQRLAILKEATYILRKKCRNTLIYLDAGHPGWLSPAIAVGLLLKGGVWNADGIALNVSNSYTEEDTYRYGLKIVEAISPTHGIMIDTSRSGAGPPPKNITGTEAWANSPYNRIGRAATLKVDPPNIYTSRLHGFLWIKTPGESDGAYKGAPPAGMFYPAAAERLLR